MHRSLLRLPLAFVVAMVMAGLGISPAIAGTGNPGEWGRSVKDRTGQDREQLPPPRQKSYGKPKDVVFRDGLCVENYDVAPEQRRPYECGYRRSGEGPQAHTLTLAQQAWARLRPPAPAVKTAPPRGKKILVHLPTYLWLDESQWSTRSDTARAGRKWAKITASAQQLVIDPGDGGDVVRCAAPGVPYAHDIPAEEACTFTYAHSGTYTVTLTASWGADWTGSDGDGGQLSAVGRSTSFQVTVVEARSELIDGD